MGSYAECWLSSFYLGSTKGQIDPSIIQLFRSSDRKIIPGLKKDIPFQLHRWVDDVDEDEMIEVVYYSTPLKIIRDRLNLDGYTLETSKIAFQNWIEKEIATYEHWSQKKHGEVFLEQVKLLKTMNADTWMSTLKQISKEGLVQGKRNNKNTKYQGTLLGYMLDNRTGWYGYPGWDLKVAIRLALEILPETDELVYDLTDLILSGDYSKDEDFVETWTRNSKTIVLTEGNIDTWVISESLQLLYPHISDYFTFMDFEGARVGGGAGSLANIVKAFSGTGIVNKVAVFFDNDTAAATALRGLKPVQIPSNIKIIQLPELDFLKNYPTLGPSGLVAMDINGLAASIELYLGKDVLIDTSNNFIPIQWAGYVPELGRYQGEIMAKEDIQKRFRKKVTDCKINKELLANTDWGSLQAILQSLFTAFHELDREEILSFVDELD
jgi:hypothetical protein